jgi:Ca-activated chloride channel homolog
LQLYKVQADWGQRIQAQITVPEMAGATAEAIDGIRYLDTALISPIGEDVYAVFAKKVPGGSYTKAVLTKRGLVKAVTSKEIRYLNRNGANNQDTGTSTPGEYYIAVSLTRKDDDKAFAIPLTLTVGLQGTAGTGKPTYVDGATPVSGDSITPTPTAEPSETPAGDKGGDKTEAGGPVQGSSDSDDGTPVVLVAGLGGGGLALLLVGLFAVLRLRKKPAVAQPGVAPWQQGQQQYPNQPPQYPNQGGQPPYPNQGGQPPQQPPHR